MNDIHTDNYTSLILKILSEKNLGETNLVINSNPYLYAVTNNNADNAKEGMIGYFYTDKKSGLKKILLKADITQADISDTLQRVSYPSDKGRRKLLNTSEKFIEHLTRHEMAHAFGLSQNNEHAADEQAFEEMGFNENQTGF